MPRSKQPYKSLDGAYARPVHQELQDFFNNVRSKPQQQVKQQPSRDLIGFDILNRHFDTVFKQRISLVSYKVFIQYFKFDSAGNQRPLGETYVVRVERNTLGYVKQKLPNKRPGFRFFFKDQNNTYEEVEDDNLPVPYREKDSIRNIYCQVIQAYTPS